MTPALLLSCSRCGVQAPLREPRDFALGWGRIELSECVAEPHPQAGKVLRLQASPICDLCPSCLQYAKNAVERL